MSVTISFGEWQDVRTYDWPDGGGGQLWRQGFAVRWARSLEPHILFCLRVRIRVKGMEIEQGFTIREIEKEL
jgi:hypothetical protein